MFFYYAYIFCYRHYRSNNSDGMIGISYRISKVISQHVYVIEIYLLVFRRIN